MHRISSVGFEHRACKRDEFLFRLNITEILLRATLLYLLWVQYDNIY